MGNSLREKPKRKATKRSCESCGNFSKNLRISKNGKFLCFKCYRKTVTGIGDYNPLTLQQALDRVYTLRTYYQKNQGRTIVFKTFPFILGGKRVKLVLVD